MLALVIGVPVSSLSTGQKLPWPLFKPAEQRIEFSFQDEPTPNYLLKHLPQQKQFECN